MWAKSLPPLHPSIAGVISIIPAIKLPSSAFSYLNKKPEEEKANIRLKNIESHKRLLTKVKKDPTSLLKIPTGININIFLKIKLNSEKKKYTTA